jgi:hypothetical protein
MKKKARILDATAGNRTIWKTKESPFIIYLDQEKELEIRPDIISDNTDTDYPDNYFHTIFYDPPHGWGETSSFYINKNYKQSKKYWNKYNRPQYISKFPRYYGLDVYKSKQELLNHIGKASNEFYRILQDGGTLWLKWCEIKIPLKEVLDLFVNWDEFLRIYICHPLQNQSKQAGKKSPQTYWVMLMKKYSGKIQSIL